MQGHVKPRLLMSGKVNIIYSYAVQFRICSFLIDDIIIIYGS